ncbi:MAG: hypothetical protein AMXMBFR57_35980 [Acidimicrobiia bacterium]
MTTHDDELLKEIGALLDVEPSRTFDAGVRARLVAQRQRRTWLYGVVLCGTAAAAVMFAVTSSTTLPTPTGVSVASTPVAPNETPGVVPEPPSAVAAPSPPRAVRLAPVLVATEPARPVVTSQMALLRELWSQVDSPAVLTETPVAIPAPVMEDVFVPAVVVEPVVLPVSTDVERPTLLPIIRRAVAAPQSR